MIPRYRAWDINDKEMVDVDTINWNDGKLDFIGDGITEFRKADDIKLMQSTGLADKYGKEIFEGDILKVTNLSSWLEVVSFNKNKAMFVSKETKREVEETPLYDLFNTDIFEVEIIGNIHTNPELAEVSS